MLKTTHTLQPSHVFSIICVKTTFLNEGCQNDPAWKQCKNWSLKECRKNPVWMEVHCPVTCRVCGE